MSKNIIKRENETILKLKMASANYGVDISPGEQLSGEEELSNKGEKSV